MRLQQVIFWLIVRVQSSSAFKNEPKSELLPNEQLHETWFSLKNSINVTKLFEDVEVLIDETKIMLDGNLEKVKSGAVDSTQVEDDIDCLSQALVNVQSSSVFKNEPKSRKIELSGMLPSE